MVPTSDSPLEGMFDKLVQKVNRSGCAETSVQDGDGSYDISHMLNVGHRENGNWFD